jgi:hypothetical protein
MADNITKLNLLNSIITWVVTLMVYSLNNLSARLQLDFTLKMNS